MHPDGLYQETPWPRIGIPRRCVRGKRTDEVSRFQGMRWVFEEAIVRLDPVYCRHIEWASEAMFPGERWVRRCARIARHDVRRFDRADCDEEMPTWVGSTRTVVEPTPSHTARQRVHQLCAGGGDECGEASGDFRVAVFGRVLIAHGCSWG